MLRKLIKAIGELMLTDVIGDVRERILQTFPDRQIYLRSGGEVTYFNVSTRIQISAVAAILFMALWCTLTIANLIFGFNPFFSKDEHVQNIESRYERLLADSQAKEENAQTLLAEQRESFEIMASNLEAKHRTMSQIIRTGALIDGALDQQQDYADASVLMAPTTRDTEERVARFASLETPAFNIGYDFDASLTAMNGAQNQMLLSAEDRLLDKIAFNRALITATGMDIDTVLDERSGGQGGPFIPIDGFEVPSDGQDFQPRITTIQARLSEAEMLDNVVATLPLKHPVQNETVMTSSFGVRRDPFTKRPTFHQGLDFIGGSMAPIVATGPGTVRFAGRKGAYGRVVEIDHGNGFVTRYAHLKKTVVTRGQVVEAGEMIGGMGSTGRSTATHLHYEVHFQGRAYDPQKFLKAGLYVQ